MQLSIPRWLLAAGGIALLVLTSVASYIGFQIGRGDAPPPEVLVEFKQDVVEPSDFEYERPDRIVVHKAPDSSNTAEACSTVPKSLLKDRSEDVRADLNSVGPSVPDDVTDFQRRLARLPYFVVPLDGMSPAWSVTRRQVTLNGFLPDNGQGVSFTRKVPQPKNALLATLQSSIWKQGLSARGEILYARDVGPFWTFGGAGYRTSSTIEDPLRGGYATIGLQKRVSF